MKIGKKTAFATVLMSSLMVGGVAVAAKQVVINPVGSVNFRCTGGMSNHGHEFYTGMTIFDGDPEVVIVDDVTYDTDFGPDEDGNPIPAGFRVEAVSMGVHAGTHIDVPTHFLEDTEDETYRKLDDLNPEEFVWATYVIDVRERMQTEPVFQLTVDDVRQYERRNGRIERGSLVIIQTGFEERFGTDDFLAPAPGFSGAAVQWLFDNRYISGTGSDTYGPDAGDDELFDATFTTLANDGITVVALANVDDLGIRGDVLIAPAVRLRDGTGFPVNPISCQGNKSRPRTGPSTLHLDTEG